MEELLVKTKKKLNYLAGDNKRYYEMTVFYMLTPKGLLFVNNNYFQLIIKSKAEIVTYPFSFSLILRNCTET